MAHKRLSLGQPARYEIKIQGELDRSWSSSLDGVTVSVADAGQETAVTTLTHIITDQAGLVGLVRRLHGMGLVLLSIVCTGRAATRPKPQQEN